MVNANSLAIVRQGIAQLTDPAYLRENAVRLLGKSLWWVNRCGGPSLWTQDAIENNIKSGPHGLHVDIWEDQFPIESVIKECAQMLGVLVEAYAADGSSTATNDFSDAVKQSLWSAASKYHDRHDLNALYFSSTRYAQRDSYLKCFACLDFITCLSNPI